MTDTTKKENKMINHHNNHKNNRDTNKHYYYSKLWNFIPTSSIVTHEKTKPPSLCRQNRMLNAIKHCQNISLWKSTRIEPPFLPFDKPNSYNDCVFIDQKYNGQLSFINQVDLNTDMFDAVLLKKVVVQSTKKTRNVGPHKLKSKTTMNKKKSHLKK